MSKFYWIIYILGEFYDLKRLVDLRLSEGSRMEINSSLKRE